MLITGEAFNAQLSRGEVEKLSQTTASEIALSSMTDGVVTLDSQGAILWLNPAAEKILGLKAEETQGRSYAQVFFHRPGKRRLQPGPSGRHIHP